MRSNGYTQQSPAFQAALWALKIVAILIGLPLSLVSLMSAMSIFTDTLWVQLIPALIVAVVFPLLVAERLARDDRGRRREGLGSDVLAVLWMGFGLLYFVGAFPVTQHLLVHEAELLEARVGRNASIVNWLARGGPLFPQRSETFDDDGEDSDLGDAGVEEEVESSSEESRDAGPDEEAWVAFDAGFAGHAGDSDVDVQVEVELPELTPSELFKAMLPSTVTLSIRGYDKRVTSATGVVITSAEILTAARVVQRAVSIAVKTHDGRWLQPVEVSGISTERGLALLTLSEESSLTPAKLGASREVTPGEKVFIIGNPLGLSATLTQGELLEIEGAPGAERLRVSASTSLGNVGGPVVTSRGELVGVAQFELPSTTVLPRRSAIPNIVAPIDAVDTLVGQGVENLQPGEGDPLPLTW